MTVLNNNLKPLTDKKNAQLVTGAHQINPVGIRQIKQILEILDR